MARAGINRGRVVVTSHFIEAVRVFHLVQDHLGQADLLPIVKGSNDITLVVKVDSLEDSIRVAVLGGGVSRAFGNIGLFPIDHLVASLGIAINPIPLALTQEPKSSEVQIHRHDLRTGRGNS